MLLGRLQCVLRFSHCCKQHSMHDSPDLLPLPPQTCLSSLTPLIPNASHPYHTCSCRPMAC